MSSNDFQQKVNLAAYNNSWYKPGGIVKKALWMVINSLFFNHGLAVISPLKCSLLRLFGAKVGVGVCIKPFVNIKYPWLLSIGDHCWIGEQVWIDNLAPVHIGNHVCISQGAMLLTGNHDFKKTTFDLLIGSIVLEDGSWIGARATVCPGVIVHSHAVLTVGSIAAQNLDAYGIYKGSPAQMVKKRAIEKFLR